MEDIVVSAPGKVILHGEHAVVYGKVALASALNLRTFLRIRKKNDGKISLNLPNIDINTSWEIKNLKNRLQLPLCDPLKPNCVENEVLDQLKVIAGISPDSSQTTELALIAFLYLMGSITVTSGDLPSIEVTVSSNLPISAGLGSSAGYSVCLAASLLHLNGFIASQGSGDTTGWSKDDMALINSWAFQGEKIIHGNPSGIDNSVSSYGGAIRFQSGKIMPIEKMPKLRILLINTKIPRSTKKLVAVARDLYNTLPNIMQPILDSIEAVTEKCQTVLAQLVNDGTDENYKTLEKLIDINQHLLEAMGVSHPALNSIVMVTCKYGLHSKLTGAGGGGCAFTLLRPDTTEDKITNIKKELNILGYDCWETSVGANGVNRHLDLNSSLFPSNLL
ncbi:mevalonate kinase [Patella vulgata]|uniref:mevalonate kinase n=1 Tax=Patella vulgata TaxID=6465 RepID=UPI00217FA2D9|nr:mevalonate kinase [Patella vulgata]